jgi:hypothetical protein
MNMWASKNMRLSALVCALMVASSAAAWIVAPRHLMAQSTSLEQTVPLKIGDWTALKEGVPQMALAVAPDGQRSEEQPYDEVVMRTYVNSHGEQVMVALAYAREQRQEVKIHRPEVCYQAQGYKNLSGRTHGDTGLAPVDEQQQPDGSGQLLDTGRQRLSARRPRYPADDIERWV